jgi:hypothetical protein
MVRAAEGFPAGVPQLSFQLQGMVERSCTIPSLIFQLVSLINIDQQFINSIGFRQLN